MESPSEIFLFFIFDSIILFSSSQVFSINRNCFFSRNFTSLTNQANAQTAITTLDEQQEEVLSLRGSIGASLARIDVALGAIGAQALEAQNARARIIDADVATESANLTGSTILQQTAAAVLAQANLQPSIALDLLI